MINTTIIVLTTFLGSITALLLAIHKIKVEKNKELKLKEEYELERIRKENLERERIKSWEDLKNHPIFPSLMSLIHTTISANDIISNSKRNMIQESLQSRMRSWYNELMLMITHEGLVDGGYILDNGKILSDWFYNVIGKLHMEQMQTFPKSYVTIYFSKYINKIGITTARGVGEVFDNHENIYHSDIDKMWAMFTIVQDTLSMLWTIGVETANAMNGELERETDCNSRWNK